MADEPDDELLLTDELHDDVQVGEPADTDDVTIHIDGEDEPEDTPLIKQLRQRERDLARENAELKRGQQPQAPRDPGKKPDLWDDCEGDADKFEVALTAWNDAKRAVSEFSRKQEEAQTARNHQFERTVANYRGRAAQLGVKDFADVEATVTAKVPELLRNAVLQYADDPAKVMYALGKHPARLDKLVADGDPDMGGDPIKFILGISKLEREIKVVNRRKPPEPEADTIQRGSAPLSKPKEDAKLKKLEEEARRTGNRTELIAYKVAKEAKK